MYATVILSSKVSCLKIDIPPHSTRRHDKASLNFQSDTPHLRNWSHANIFNQFPSMTPSSLLFLAVWKCPHHRSLFIRLIPAVLAMLPTITRSSKTTTLFPPFLSPSATESLCYTHYLLLSLATFGSHSSAASKNTLSFIPHNLTVHKMKKNSVHHRLHADDMIAIKLTICQSPSIMYYSRFRLKVVVSLTLTVAPFKQAARLPRLFKMTRCWRKNEKVFDSEVKDM